jgi:hypothetical protein
VSALDLIFNKLGEMIVEAHGRVLAHRERMAPETGTFATRLKPARP